jgi:CubicO group peptidase (beta-lactamase class C family)
MQLVQAGKLNLDDSLGKFFPQFPYPGNTVRNLLNHSSGIPYYANFMDKYGWDKKQVATNADVLYSLYANRPPQEFTPGSRFRYCNTNFVLLALIVEKVSGRFFPDFIKDSIFTPCGMSHSYVVSQKNPQDFIPSFYPGNRIYNFDYLDGVYGDKNVFTTCRDMLKYDSCIRENVLLSKSSYEQVWKPYFKDTHYHDTSEYYGLGWRLKIFDDSTIIPYHNGWWHGNNSVFQRLIPDTAVIIVTGNRFTNRIYQSAKAANVFRPYYNRGDLQADSQGEVQEQGTGIKRKSVVSSSKRQPAKKRKRVPGKRKR